MRFQFVFEGIRGQGYQGDIAIDDIKLTKGACSSPGSCNFENGRCTWTNAQTGDDFDWRVGSGTTSTFGTGPSKDHTTGTARGHYQYLEASFPRKPGEKTWLVSQNFQPTTGGCFSFWYNMNGRNIGTLNIIIQVCLYCKHAKNLDTCIAVMIADGIAIMKASGAIWAWSEPFALTDLSASIFFT